jgi:hypothetical protein
MARRDNGLESDEWLPLADVEAALSAHVLDALAEAGIAAYAETANPGSSDLASIWGPTAPGRTGAPSDRIHVARDGRTDARALLADLLPELRAELAQERQAVEDETWSQIVSGIEADGGLPASQEEPTPAAAGSEGAAGDDEWGKRPAMPAELDERDDDHFVPPEAPPLPTTDAVTRAAWIGIVAGPLFLLLATLLDWQADGIPALLAVAAFVGGFVTLVARMKERPTLDESGDDGAVV